MAIIGQIAIRTKYNPVKDGNLAANWQGGRGGNDGAGASLFCFEDWRCIFARRVDGSLNYEENEPLIQKTESMPHTKYINRTERKVADTIDPALLAEVRAYLSMRYERRLNNKLGGRQPVNLKIIPSTTGTSEESANTYITFPEDQVKGAIGDIFLRSNGRLLLLGAPGAGKTTLVLQLALFLLEREGVSMPVVLNLATWTSKFKTLDEWLSEILPAELAVSAPFAKKIRSNIPLILLLDGLDEVPEADRGTCIDALGEYGSNAQHQFLISSRIDEYSATKDAPVNAQIEVQQLTIEQVELALMATAHLQPESSRLLNALKTDPLLREAMENPFYLNTAQLLFSTGKNWSAFGFVASDVAGRQQEIKHFFIRDALQRKENYPSEKSERWLSFLASRMNQRNMVVFELRDLQYDWWHSWSKLELLLAGMIGGFIKGLNGVIFGACASVLIFLLVGFKSDLATILLGAFKGGVSIIIILGLFQGLIGFYYSINTKDDVKWSWKNFADGLNLNISISFGMLLGGMLFVIGWLALGFKSAILSGVIGILLGWLIGGLIFLLNTSNDILQIATPYQRFYLSMKTLHFSIIQHKFLIYQLYRRGLLPFRLVFFLQKMSLRHILEFDGDPTTGKGGGSWRFRHRILQEYFAERWVEPDRNV